MSIEAEKRRRIAEIAEALQRVWPGLDTADGDPEIEAGSVLIKYVVVADWIMPDGERLVSKCGGNLDGEGSTMWDMAGLLHEALNGDWD